MSKKEVKTETYEANIANQFMEAREWYALVLESKAEGDKEIVSHIQYQIDLLLRQNYVIHKIFNNEKQR